MYDDDDSIVDDDGKRYCAVQRPALYLQSEWWRPFGPNQEEYLPVAQGKC